MSQAGQFYRNGLISTLTGDIGGAITPIAGNIDINGGTGVLVVGTPGKLTISVSGVAASFPTDAGTAVPVAGALRILGGANINTTGAGNTVTVILDNDVTLSGQLEANQIESITYITAGTYITAVTGDISAPGGNIISGGQVTATGDIISVAGDLTATVGDLEIGGIAEVSGNITSLLGSIIAQNNVIANTGNITSTLGSVSAATTVIAGTTITAGTGITSTIGNITATNGVVVGGSGVTALTGNIIANTGNITATLGNISTGVGSISSASTITAVGNITSSTGNLVSTLGGVTAKTNITTTNGNITAPAGTITAFGNVTSSNGNVVASTGQVIAGTTMVATGDITSTTGDIVSSTGDIRAPLGTLYVANFSSAGDIVSTGGNLIATIGNVQSGARVIAGTGVTVTAGGVLVTGGDILVQTGAITAQNNITSLNGSVFAYNGDIHAGYDVVAGSDINAILGDITAEMGSVIAQEDIISTTGNIEAQQGDITTLVGFIRSGGAVIADANLKATGTVQFPSITNGALIANATGYVSVSAGISNPFTGFASWGGAGNYFDDTTLGSFSILRPGTGYIKGLLVSWTATQTITGLTAGNTYLIYIDSTGTIGKTTTFDLTTFENYIVLFECLRDSTGTNVQYTLKENHPYGFPSTVSIYAHEVIGTVIENIDKGANITLNGTQKVQINGADKLSDHGLYTDIPDSGGVAVSWKKMYTNGSGKWATFNTTDTFVGTWNNAGTPTAPTGTKWSLYTLYVSKDNLNSSTPTYWAVLNTSEYNTLAAAQSAISNGTNTIATNELAKLELAQLGHIIYQQLTNTIVQVNISKSTLRANVSGGGGSSIASLVTTVTTNFDGILSAADTNVQAALETIDEWGKTTTDHALLIGNGTGIAIGSLAVGATNEILVGATGADPAWSATPTVTTMNATTFDTNVVAAAVTLAGTTLSADGTDSNININITAKGTGQVIIDDLQLTTDLAVTEGGTGASTLTDHGVLIGSGTAAITPLTVGTNGQVLLGSTGADPVFATLASAGGTVTFTPGAGTLNLEAAGGGITWSEQTGTTQAMAVDNGYILNNAGLVTATLPATAALGKVMRIAGKGAGGWKIAQNAGQTIHVIGSATTTGAGGYLASTAQYDAVELLCITANTDFEVISVVGNITIA